MLQTFPFDSTVSDRSENLCNEASFPTRLLPCNRFPHPRPIYRKATSERSSLLRFPPGELGRLDGAHLLGPAGRGRLLAHGTDLVLGEARNADVVGALEHELEVAQLESVVAAKLGNLACGRHSLIDKVIGVLQHGLNERNAPVSFWSLILRREKRRGSHE